MRLPMNMRRIATVTVVCSALVTGGFIPAFGHNHDRHDKPGHHQKLTQNYEHKHWWGYLYAKIEALLQGLNTQILDLSAKVKLFDGISAQFTALNNSVTASLATMAGQYNSLMGEFKTLTDKVNGLDARLNNYVLVADLNQRMSDVNTSITNLANSLNLKIDGVTGDIKALAGRVELLEKAPATGSGLSVVDAGGVRLGDFVGFDPTYTPLVGMTAQNHSFVLRVTEHGLRGDMVFFEKLDCQGLAYVAPILDNGDQKKAVSLAGIRKDNVNKLYFVYVTEANQTLNSLNGGFEVWSVAQNGSGCENFLDLSTTGPALLATVQMEVPDTGPFYVK